MPTNLPATGARNPVVSKSTIIVALLLYSACACAIAIADGIGHGSAPILEVVAAQARSGL